MFTLITNQHFRSELIVLVPLILSAYIHLWNVGGFPSIHIDEAHYMRRVMQVINGLGPQESASTGYIRTYDHPYFGQLFLGGILKSIGYPGLYSTGSLLSSVEILHLIPRLVMGSLAILDTFLLYKIVQMRYNKTTALIAALLFAVMPMTWILRRVYLDTLLMPLLFSSILFALYSREPKIIDSRILGIINKNVLIILSGIFLGLAIYTKIPTFTFIPLVGFIIFFNSVSIKRLMMWLAPVFLIPLLWPLHAAVMGQSDLWAQWVLWQTERNKPLDRSLNSFFQIDPIIMIGGIAGTIFASLRKDFFPLIWAGPFLVFSSLIGWVQYFHLIVIFPAFCIAFAILIESARMKLMNHGWRKLSNVLIASIIIFGIIITTMIITLNVNSTNYKIYAAIAEKIPTNSKVTVIGSHWWDWDTLWLTKFVMHKDHELIDPMFDPSFRSPINTEKALFIDDSRFEEGFLRNIRGANILDVRQLYDQSKPISVFVDNMTNNTPTYYPYNILKIMIENENHPQGKVTIRANY
jgi:4-amino-4-deoxy-L-arabinose transferase-like glycosyltransferase